VIRILVADDHPIVRYGLTERLRLEDDLKVVAEAPDGLMALNLLIKLTPDVVLLDLYMPGMDGLSVLRELQGLSNPAKVVILTASENKSQFVDALKLGCRGILNKQILPDKIVECIRRVNSGEVWLDLGVTATLMGPFGGLNHENSPGVGKAEREIRRLTTREREVVQCVAHGLKHKHIGEKLRISLQTVKNHLHNIFEKLCIFDRLELALFALHKGLDVNPNVLYFGHVQVPDVVVVGAPSQMRGTKVVEGRVVAALAPPTSMECRPVLGIGADHLVSPIEPMHLNH
jgi:two-component system nitrate/nitrite response regulator NarL